MAPGWRCGEGIGPRGGTWSGLEEAGAVGEEAAEVAGDADADGGQKDGGASEIVVPAAEAIALGDDECDRGEDRGGSADPAVEAEDGCGAAFFFHGVEPAEARGDDGAECAEPEAEADG